MSTATADKNNPVRILHVFGGLSMGGAETRTIDLYRHIDRDKVQFDFLVHTDTSVSGNSAPSSDDLMEVRAPEQYDETVRALGARIYAVPRFKGINRRAYEKALRQFFSAHRGEWKMVHGHMTSTAAIYLPIAKAYGDVSATIAHARNAGVTPGLKGLYTKWLRRPLGREGFVDYRFAVSTDSAVAVFGKKAVDQGLVQVLPNAIDTEQYRFDPAVRTRIRDELHIPQNAIVVGHVGRFFYSKNHEYVLRVFVEMLSQYITTSSAKDPIPPQLLLLLIGEGERMEEIKQLARSEGITPYVIFAGKRSPSAPYYQAMDAFFFPSRYEGFPGVVLEAQASGLPCLISDVITPEVDRTDLVERFDIHTPVRKTAARISRICISRGITTPVFNADHRAAQSDKAIQTLKKDRYDSAVQAENYEKIYLG